MRRVVLCWIQESMKVFHDKPNGHILAAAANKHLRSSRNLRLMPCRSPHSPNYDSQCCSDVSEEDRGTGLNYSNTERERHVVCVRERERGEEQPLSKLLTKSLSACLVVI